MSDCVGALARDPAYLGRGPPHAAEIRGRGGPPPPNNIDKEASVVSLLSEIN
jgi:hypothetical protein